MVLVLPALDSDYENAVKLIQRTWVAKYDVEDVNKHLAERFVVSLNSFSGTNAQINVIS